MTRPARLLDRYRRQHGRTWQAADAFHDASSCARCSPFTRGARISASELVPVLAKFKKRTSLTDSIHPARMSRFSASFVESRAALLTECEWAGVTRTGLTRVYVPRLPKPVTGRRSIQIAATLLRAWQRVRNPGVEAWAQRALSPLDWCNTVGRSVTMSVWRDIVLSIHGSGSGAHSVSVLGAVRKCFESICWRRLLQAAERHQYPVSTMRYSLINYASPRAVMLGRLIALPLVPSRGIAAGSCFATFETSLT